MATETYGHLLEGLTQTPIWMQDCTNIVPIIILCCSPRHMVARAICKQQAGQPPCWTGLSTANPQTKWLQWPTNMSHSHPPQKVKQYYVHPPSVTYFLIIISTTYNCISRKLYKHDSKTVAIPLRIISSVLQPTNDHTALKTPRVYSTPYKCGKIYMGQTGHSIKTTVKIHQHHIQLHHLKNQLRANTASTSAMLSC